MVPKGHTQHVKCRWSWIVEVERKCKRLWLVWSTFIIYFAIIDLENGGKDLIGRLDVRDVYV